MPKQTLGMFISLSAAILVACSSGGAHDRDMLTIQLSDDAQKCSVQGQEVSCSDLPGYLEKTLKLSKTTQIALSIKPGRTDSALSQLAQGLKKSGYSNVVAWEIGFETEPKGMLQN